MCRFHVTKPLLNAFLIFLIMMMSIVFYSLPASAYETDTAGNAYSSEASVGSESISSDLIWFGNDLTLDGTSIGGDLLAAGNSILVDSADIEGNVRSFSGSMTINSTYVGGNVTIWGQDVQIGQGSAGGGVSILGSDIGFYGTADALRAIGSTVVIDGVIDGDVSISADSVTIGAGTVVTGTLTVRSSNEPVVQDGAQIGQYVYEPDSAVSWASSLSPFSMLASGAGGVMLTALSIIMILVTALLLTLVMRREIDASVVHIREHPVRHAVIGALTVVLMPLSIIVLILILVTIWVAFAIGLVVIVLAMISISFTGAAIGRLVFCKISPYATCILGTLVTCILLTVPYLVTIALMICFLYTAGYFACSTGARIRRNVFAPKDGEAGQAGSAR